MTGQRRGIEAKSQLRGKRRYEARDSSAETREMSGTYVPIRKEEI